MKINYVYIFDPVIPFIIKSSGIILSNISDQMMYISKDGYIKPVKLSYVYKEIIKNIRLSSSEKSEWVYILRIYIKTYKENLQQNNLPFHRTFTTNNIMRIIRNFAPYKRQKYIFAKIFNIYKIDDCPICFENTRMIKLHRSNHCVCINCFVKIDNCPLCRHDI